MLASETKPTGKYGIFRRDRAGKLIEWKQHLYLVVKCSSFRFMTSSFSSINIEF